MQATVEITTRTFDNVIDRKSTNSEKWAAAATMLTADQAAADPLPMWVADMDFQSPPAVLNALSEAVQHGIFGYAAGATKRYIASVQNWQARRFGWEISADWIIQTPGIITALKQIVQAFSAPGDAVLIQPPVYSHFRDDVVLNGRRPIEAPLALVGERYIFNEAAFEAAITPDTKIFILCNPHNPTGNVWAEGDLRSMGEICQRHGIIVVSDEIHQDLIINPELKHIPFGSLSQDFALNSITCTAPSKTFNLAGLQSANLIIQNPNLREEFRRQYNRNMTTDLNLLGLIAAEAAYSEGEPWLEQLLVYLRANHERFANAINSSDIGLRVLPADSLYLAWMDCRSLDMEADELNHFMLTEVGLWLDKGQKFGIEGRGFMRVNIGCPRATVDEAISRLLTARTASRS
ncbi:MalY/PatB family protein [Ochrobactrum sp. RH2CCR150]|uniref:MalY/PatB family protein n=1 Tax=Ochrobactrum sp. RH2CCR150 TaxID=2587044 RepID=UPI0017B031F0|nr:cystathionine beta-lyase [Ochrobactrum sp. RH2CCR150]